MAQIYEVSFTYTIAVKAKNKDEAEKLALEDMYDQDINLLEQGNITTKICKEPEIWEGCYIVGKEA